MRQWKAGLVTAVMAGVVGFGCGVGLEEEEEATSGATAHYVEQLSGSGPNQCGKRICFDPIVRDKNITHIFLDFGNCPVKDFRVFLTTEHFGTVEVDKIKSKGGPCKELDADYHFEVPGPDKKAKVCIVFKDYVTDDVRIGAKSADECRYEGTNGLQSFKKDDCRKCPKNDHPK
ncbi:hypothetical protein [Hyalangium rubrum]|uniref:Lipoprotein n=1 Tax=Hyalangium rubrum TaxID=3103134 RepID=A0ABU5H522_9BACT|nr:hypothetical protein [Hyalangium sp. s54d21]MDY7228174.1 hypothetical protein [Hyalangium sp. s54d21]